MAMSPGRRRRTETHTRIIPHTISGKTHHVPDEYEVEVLPVPRDWDQIVLTIATATAVAVGIGCILWSTNSIGTLLSAAASAAVAYPVAGSFDLLWITCHAVEWLARFEPEKARRARRGGRLSLLVAMSALVAEGVVNGHPVAGIVGAFISASVKGVWSLVLSLHAYPLDNLTLGWVRREKSEVGGLLALAAARRRLARSHAQLAAYDNVLSVGQDNGGPGPDQPSGQPSPLSGPADMLSADVRSAVEKALALLPGSTAEEVVQQLALAGLPVSADSVRAVAEQLEDEQDNVLSFPRERPTVTAAVRGFVKESGQTDLDVVFAAVRLVHPSAKRDTVRKALERAPGASSAPATTGATP
ncbi:hypothetical protein [Kitasatospora sp. NPDC088548]|uniref:hypothetical protein n=1 Tax=Kitasatospora sp. NPDC088548 TaxID=3364075 RepID=UPI0038234284